MKTIKYKHSRQRVVQLVLEAVLVGYLLLNPSESKAVSIATSVSGASGPWDVLLNPGYAYGISIGGVDNYNLPPTVVDSSSGLPLTVGDSVIFTSLTPGQTTLLAGGGGTVWSDANGIPWWPLAVGSPGQYIPETVYLEELIGTFAYNGVIVGTPFAIGNGPTKQTIPSGVNQLLLGVQDSWYNDNGGSVNVSITEVPDQVPDSCSTILLLGTALSAIALIRRRCNAASSELVAA